MPKMRLKRGEYISRSFVCPAGILDDCEERIISRVRRASGWKANRSRLLQALLQIAGSSTKSFDAGNVIDQASFEEALRDAICDATRSVRRR